MDKSSAESVALKLSIPEGSLALTYDSLDTSKIVNSVADHAAGATAVFIGTTRNTFKGKVVNRLEYQAYTKLAIKTIADIVREAVDHSSRTNETSGLLRCAVHHRLGTVDVGQPSIVIAVSSPHRKEAFTACEFILEQVKMKAQIWKREFYEGEPPSNAQWKMNYEK